MIPDFFPVWVESSAADGSVPTHAVTNKENSEIGMKRVVFGDPTLMHKSVRCFSVEFRKFLVCFHSHTFFWCLIPLKIPQFLSY